MQEASAMNGNGTLHKNTIVQENSFAKIKAHLEEVTDKGQKLAPDDLNARRQLLDAARTLCTELESPMEAVFRTVIIQVAYSDRLKGWNRGLINENSLSCTCAFGLPLTWIYSP